MTPPASSSSETMARPSTFDVLILIGRPASGKSEIIDFLRRTPGDVRRRRYHVNHLDVIDDFPMLWAWFEEDDILEHRLGQPRLHTDADGYFKHRYLWHLLIERISLTYRKRLRDDPAYHTHTTALIEFSRGSEHGGYREAFQHLDDAILRRAGVVYVNVSFEESLRKNRRRFNPERPDSILEHGLPDEKLTRLYRDDDWRQFTSGLTSDDPNVVSVAARAEAHAAAINTPYVVFENEDDVTTNTPDLLARRLETVMSQLWAKRSRM